MSKLTNNFYVNEKYFEEFCRNIYTLLLYMQIIISEKQFNRYCTADSAKKWEKMKIITF